MSGNDFFISIDLASPTLGVSKGPTGEVSNTVGGFWGKIQNESVGPIPPSR